MSRYAPGSIALMTALLAACTSVSGRDDITCFEYQASPAAMAAQLFPGVISNTDVVECRHGQPTAAFAFQVCAIKLKGDAAAQVTFIRFDRLHPLRDDPVPELVQELANDHGIKLAYLYRRMSSRESIQEILQGGEMCPRRCALQVFGCSRARCRFSSAGAQGSVGS
jgi:hypothetical protein